MRRIVKTVVGELHEEPAEKPKFKKIMDDRHILFSTHVATWDRMRKEHGTDLVKTACLPHFGGDHENPDHLEGVAASDNLLPLTSL